MRVLLNLRDGQVHPEPVRIPLGFQVPLGFIIHDPNHIIFNIHVRYNGQERSCNGKFEPRPGFV